MKKVLVSDFDKTFYLNDEDIKKNIVAVKTFRNNENIFVIATGRSFFDFKKAVSKYKLKYDFAIINHGATILDKDDNIISNFYIDNDIIKEIMDDLELKMSVNSFFCSCLDSRVSEYHNDITKINIQYSSDEIAIKINNLINEKYSSYVNSHHINKEKIEIVSNKASKYKAINLLVVNNKLNENDIYTIGDGYSDIDMVKNYNGYCMVNSVNEIKNVARYQYSSVSDLISDILNNK